MKKNANFAEVTLLLITGLLLWISFDISYIKKHISDYKPENVIDFNDLP